MAVVERGGCEGGVFNSARSVFPHPHLKKTSLLSFLKGTYSRKYGKKMETLLEGAKTEEDEGLEARLQAHFTIDRSSYFFLSISCHNKDT